MLGHLGRSPGHRGSEAAELRRWNSAQIGISRIRRPRDPDADTAAGVVDADDLGADDARL
jgi:hypothetical protein